MGLQVKRKSDNKVFDVFKYIKSNREDDQREHIWCEEWKGHHILDTDCEWYECEGKKQSNTDKQQLQQPDVIKSVCDCCSHNQYGGRWVLICRDCKDGSLKQTVL